MSIRISKSQTAKRMQVGDSLRPATSLQRDSAPLPFEQIIIMPVAENSESYLETSPIKFTKTIHKVVGFRTLSFANCKLGETAGGAQRTIHFSSSSPPSQE